MWRLTNIQATNFCSFKELSLAIPQNVATLVFGNNLDDASQNSNGSGKSALIEVIAFGLTGEPLRKLKSIEELIRDDADNSWVSLSFSNTMGGELVIERYLSRKEPQRVLVFINSNEVPTPSVNEANRYILDVIGLSKEDLYSNFILSKRTYTSFLSSSDKDKKELINRFSNGVLVDESIEALQADIAPLQEKLVSTEKDVSYMQGRISTLNEQIANITNESEYNLSQKEIKIANINSQIAAARALIRQSQTIIDINDENWGKVEQIEGQIRTIEHGSEWTSFTDAYHAIANVWNVDILGNLENYESNVAQLHRDINKLQQEIASNNDIAEQYYSEILRAESELSTVQNEYQSAQQESEEKAKELKKIVEQLKSDIVELDKELITLMSRRQKGIQYVADLKKMLAGTIECPNCHHQWVIDSTMSVEEIKQKLVEADRLQKEIDNKMQSDQEEVSTTTSTIAKRNREIAGLGAGLSDKASAVTSAKMKVNSLKGTLQVLKDSITNAEKRIVELEKQVAFAINNMFNSIYSRIDSVISAFDDTINAEEKKIANQNGIIDTLEASRKQIEEYSIADTIEPLKAALNESMESLNKAIVEKEEVERELNKLKVQEARFMEFKTYLANSKIEAISAITNQFLEAIGSDIRISFSGITMLKSGKLRDKISITLLRDGVDCGSFGKFSQGERSRCELATILALQKLINTNCEEGKGLELLVIDEVMDGTDETGLSHIFETLNNLQVTSLVISHGLIQENYQPRIIVNKENGISTI